MKAFDIVEDIKTKECHVNELERALLKLRGAGWLEGIEKDCRISTKVVYSAYIQAVKVLAEATNRNYVETYKGEEI